MENQNKKINSYLINQNSGKIDCGTPRKLFEYFDNIYHFNLDPCSNGTNALCDEYYTEADNGLVQDWSGKRCFMNPPYNYETGKWIEKAYKESLKGALVVCLIPCRPDASYWHNYIFPYASIIYFIQGRLHYSDKKETAPFPSAIVIFDETNPHRGDYRHLGLQKKAGEFYRKMV